MTERELWRLLAQRESESIECKPSLLSRNQIAEYAVGIGNSGGGWLIMGVSDRLPRRVLPFDFPNEDEIARIRDSVADSAHIHISLETVVMKDGPVLVAHIPPRPRGIPFSTRDGKYLIRLGEGLRGMTLAELDAIRREAGMEITAEAVAGAPDTLLSAAGLEELRNLMVEAGATNDLVRLSDRDLLKALGVLTDDGQLLTAGLLLAGTSDAIRSRLPHAQWQFRRMKSDTEYDQTADGYDCLPVALRRLRELVGANNPIVTIMGRLVHPEFPRYPAVALRELLINALVHRDFAAPGAVSVKLYPNRLELSNPGGFIGGVTPENILHHPSIARNPTLFQALTRMRLANASNLGVPRIFRDLLSEGKEPPFYWTTGHVVVATIKGQDARREFVELVQQFPQLDVDDLLVIHYLTRHREVRARTIAELCHRPIEDARELLSELANQWGLLEAGGSGAGRYYRLSRGVYTLLGETLGYHVDQRLSLENAKVRILTVLRNTTLTNAQIREITQLSRGQVTLLMKDMAAEGLVRLEGRGGSGHWLLSTQPDQRSERQALVLDALRAGPLSNAQLRAITKLNKDQITYLLHGLEKNNLVIRQGRTRGSLWYLTQRER